MTPNTEKAGQCAGSGLPPAELVILDTTWGEPKGTCTACKAYLTLDFYRLPPHIASSEVSS